MGKPNKVSHGSPVLKEHVELNQQKTLLIIVMQYSQYSQYEPLSSSSLHIYIDTDMKNFNQPSVHKSLASQGMMLRGRLVRVGQGDAREGAYTELTNSTREEENQKEIPPQPPPLHSRSRSLSL